MTTKCIWTQLVAESPFFTLIFICKNYYFVRKTWSKWKTLFLLIFTFACPSIRRNLFSFWASTGASFQWTFAVVLTCQKATTWSSCKKMIWNEKDLLCWIFSAIILILTTSSNLISIVFTVLDPIAKSTLFDALRGTFSTLRAVELVIRTGYCCAIILVCAIHAILVTVTSPSSRNTAMVFTTKLPTMASREV